MDGAALFYHLQELLKVMLSAVNDCCSGNVMVRYKLYNPLTMAWSLLNKNNNKMLFINVKSDGNWEKILHIFLIHPGGFSLIKSFTELNIFSTSFSKLLRITLLLKIFSGLWFFFVVIYLINELI